MFTHGPYGYYGPSSFILSRGLYSAVGTNNVTSVINQHFINLLKKAAINLCNYYLFCFYFILSCYFVVSNPILIKFSFVLVLEADIEGRFLDLIAVLIFSLHLKRFYLTSPVSCRWSNNNKMTKKENGSHWSMLTISWVNASRYVE